MVSSWHTATATDASTLRLVKLHNVWTSLIYTGQCIRSQLSNTRSFSSWLAFSNVSIACLSRIRYISACSDVRRYLFISRSIPFIVYPGRPQHASLQNQYDVIPYIDQQIPAKMCHRHPSNPRPTPFTAPREPSLLAPTYGWRTMPPTPSPSPRTNSCDMVS
jgi:hypothetical protein